MVVLTETKTATDRQTLTTEIEILYRKKFMTATYPSKKTIGRMILNLIKFSRSRGAQRWEIMTVIFAVIGRGHYDHIRDRGKYSSYFSVGNNQYGVVPRFCKKVGRKWYYNSKQ